MLDDIMTEEDAKQVNEDEDIIKLMIDNAKLRNRSCNINSSTHTG